MSAAMDWTADYSSLIAGPCCGYEASHAPAVEPTALAVLATARFSRRAEAAVKADVSTSTHLAAAIDWLLRVQNADGSFGIDATRPEPGWPTAWAALALRAANAAGQGFDETTSSAAIAAADRATAWLMQEQGAPVHSDDPSVLGHDTSLRGWPWVGSTHSWVEPTATGVLALKAAGKSESPRCREAIRLLLNRALPGGGWNYGNTTVLGNTLRPHIEPTGLALAALADEPAAGEAIRRSAAWLRRTLRPDTAAASLGYAIWGLTRCGQRPAEAEAWLHAAAARTRETGGSPYRLAVLALAASDAAAGWSAADAISSPPHLQAIGQR